MSRSDFDEFIRRQRAAKEATSKSFDPERELQEWRQYLKTLYDTIEQFMASYIEQGSAEIDYRDIELNEEFSGPYKVEQMSLTIGASIVTFKPVGTMLIGSKGRVDVQGPRGAGRLALVGKNISRARQMISVTIVNPASPQNEKPNQKQQPIEWVWKIITPAPQMQFIDLTENSFFTLIISVADA